MLWCQLTTTFRFPLILWVLMTQFTDLAHLSSKTTSRNTRSSSFRGRRSTMTSTWKALQKEHGVIMASLSGQLIKAGCIPRKISRHMHYRRDSTKVRYTTVQCTEPQDNLCQLGLEVRVEISSQEEYHHVNSKTLLPSCLFIYIKKTSQKSVRASCPQNKLWQHVFLASAAHLLELGAWSSMTWTSLSFSGTDKTQPFDVCGSS